jgi:hypothetical protein
LRAHRARNQTSHRQGPRQRGLHRIVAQIHGTTCRETSSPRPAR